MLKRLWNFFSYFTNLIFVFFNRMRKLVVNLVTGQTEIVRICLKKDAFNRTNQLEYCLSETKNGDFNDKVKVNSLLNKHEIDAIALKIFEISKISPLNMRVFNAMKDSLAKINSYNVLLNQATQIKNIKVTFENEGHVKKIKNIWNALKPNDELDLLKTKRWTEIGFQGDDPQTDFRSMGLLALLCLEYFTMNPKFSDTARKVFSRSNHPKYNYSWAIVGINITSWIYTWVESGKLKRHFYADLLDNIENESLMDKFCYIFSIIFTEFDRYWFINEFNILYFEFVSKPFCKMVERRLKDENIRLDFNFLGEITKDKNIKLPF